MGKEQDGSERSGGVNNTAVARKPWQTPLVVVSDPRNTAAHVAVGSDGTSGTYRYGS